MIFVCQNCFFRVFFVYQFWGIFREVMVFFSICFRFFVFRLRVGSFFQVLFRCLKGRDQELGFYLVRYKRNRLSFLGSSFQFLRRFKRKIRIVMFFSCGAEERRGCFMRECWGVIGEMVVDVLGKIVDFVIWGESRLFFFVQVYFFGY